MRTWLVATAFFAVVLVLVGLARRGAERAPALQNQQAPPTESDDAPIGAAVPNAPRAQSLADDGGATQSEGAPSVARDAAAPQPGSLVITGLVLEPDGRPSPRARVFLSVVEDGARPRLDFDTHGRAEDDGRFRLQSSCPAPTALLCVTAQGTRGEVVSPSPFGGTRLPDPLLQGYALVHVPAEVIAERAAGRPLTLAVEVQLEATAKVAGTVVDPRGEGLAGVELRLAPQGEALRGADPVRRASLHQETSRRGGAFTFLGVRPGSYTLEALRSERGAAVSVVVAAGDEAVCLALPPPELAEVTVEVVCADASAKVTVVRGALVPHAGVTIEAPPLPEVFDATDAAGFPGTAASLWEGSQSSSDAFGRTSVVAAPVVDGRETYSIPAGLAWFGARGVAGDGTPLIPVGTGLVAVGAGSHLVRIHLAP